MESVTYMWRELNDRGMRKSKCRLQTVAGQQTRAIAKLSLLLFRF